MKQPIKCLNCGKEKALFKVPFGYLPGKRCQKRAKANQPKETIELVSEDIKIDRKQFAKDIEQRYTGDKANLAYIKQYGTNGFTVEEVKEARNREGYYTDREERFHGN